MSFKLQPEAREKLAAAVRAVGPKRTAEVVGLNMGTIATAISGMREPMPATARVIEAAGPNVEMRQFLLRRELLDAQPDRRLRDRAEHVTNDRIGAARTLDTHSTTPRRGRSSGEWGRLAETVR